MGALRGRRPAGRRTASCGAASPNRLVRSVTRRRNRRRIVMLTASVMLLGASYGNQEISQATADTPFQALLSSDGSGRLKATNGESPQWERCTPDLANCRIFATGNEVATYGAAPDSVFRAQSGSLSPIWRGTVASQTAPTVRGRLRANELVTPVPSTWLGGWATDLNSTQLSVCRTRLASSCITLTDAKYPFGCYRGAAVLDPFFTGRYLRVANRRVALDASTTFEAHTSPFSHDAWLQDPITSVAVIGRIRPAAAPRRATCGPKPLVRAAINRHAVARIRCTLGCRAVLTIKHSSRQIRYTRRLRPFPEMAAKTSAVPRLKPSHRTLKHLGKGRAQAIVSVHGVVMARRPVYVR
jgi:hypothetical protein